MDCQECGKSIGFPGHDAYVVFDADGGERRLCAECHDAELWLSEEASDDQTG